MPPLVLLSPAPGAGKTTVAAALYLQARASDRPLILERLGDDPNAAADTQLFSQLGSPGGAALIEAPGGDLGAAPAARAVLVVDASAAPTTQIAEIGRAAGNRVVGVVLNRLPSKLRSRRLQEAQSAGLHVLLALEEDRRLATPSLGDVVDALEAETLYFDSNGDRPLGLTRIAPIAADPGQGYFTFTDATSVIVRSDKPDLQLAALNAGASCLIVTGGLSLLGYVTERAEADEIPIVRTRLDTVETVKNIEGLFARGPFSGTQAKFSRLAELTQGFDVSNLLSA